MGVFLDFYKHLFPYLLFIPFGYWVNNRKWLSKKWITNPLIYFFMPVLVINHILEADAVKLAILPVISFALAASMVLPAKLAFKKLDKANDPFLIKSSFSFFNVAFFGIPVVTALFGGDGVTVLICIYVGTALYGNTIGYYQVARSKYSNREAIAKIFKIPFIYVFLLALLFKFVKIEMPASLVPVVDVFSVVVSAGGMMIVGMNVLKVDFNALAKKYFSKLLALRVLSALAIMALLVTLEYAVMNYLEKEDRQMLALIPFFPVAANVTLYASFLGSKEETSALLVLLSMLLSLILVPLAAVFF